MDPGELEHARCRLGRVRLAVALDDGPQHGGLPLGDERVQGLGRPGRVRGGELGLDRRPVGERRDTGERRARGRLARGVDGHPARVVSIKCKS